MGDRIAVRLGLSDDWERTAEGRAGAIERALEVLAEDPHSIEGTSLLARARAYIIPFTRLREVAYELLEAEPTSVAGAVLASRAAGELGGVVDATARLRLALEAHPEHAAGWCALAISLDSAGPGRDLDAAQRALDRACELDPDDPVCASARGYLLTAAGRKAEAVALLSPLRGTSIACDLALADALFALRKYAEAEHLLAEILELVPDSPYALVRLAIVRRIRDRVPEARAAAEAALASGGPGVDTYTSYGLVCLRTGAHAAAVQCFEYSLQLQPDAPYTWVCLSEARRRMRDRQGASAARAEARARVEDSPLKRALGVFAATATLRLETPGQGVGLRIVMFVVLMSIPGALALSAISGFMGLAGSEWLSGGLYLVPAVAFVSLVLWLTARTRVRSTVWRLGALLFGGGLLLMTVHAALVGLGIASGSDLENTFSVLYVLAGTLGFALVFVPAPPPQLDAQGRPLPPKRLAETLQTANPDPTARAAMGVISLIIGVPTLLWAVPSTSLGAALLLLGPAEGLTSFWGAAGANALALSLPAVGGLIGLGLMVGGIVALVGRTEPLTELKRQLLLGSYGLALVGFVLWWIISVGWYALAG